MRIRYLVPLTLAASTALAAADLSYAGKWKLNPDKIELTGTTMTFESLPSAEWQSSASGVTYRFKMDEKEYPTGMGDTATWKVLSAETWQIIWKSSGGILSTYTLKVEAGGNTLTVTSKGAKPSGEPIDDSTTFQRVFGGPGLAGKWKSTHVTSSASVMELVPAGKDGLTFKQPAWGVSCEAKLDGKDYPCITPLGPDGRWLWLKLGRARWI